jgi:aminoglycoside phosphotransferase (APT) family kinase protein
VIDWPNAHAGDPLCDVALTYALMLCGHMPGPAHLSTLMQPLRAALVGKPFISRYECAALWERIAAMAELKILDPNMYADETRALRQLAAHARHHGPPQHH